MSQSLATRGFISPATGSGGGGGSGPSGIAIPFEMVDDDGVYTDGVDVSGDIYLSTNGVDFDVPVNSPVNVGGTPVGRYYLELDGTEVDTNWVWLVIQKSGFRVVSVVWPIDDDPTNADLDAAVTTLANDIAAAQSAIVSEVEERPTAEELDVFLSNVHGAGSWEGASAEEIDAQLSATHGEGSWDTGTDPQDLVDDAEIYPGMKLGDAIRGIMALCGGPSSDYRTGTIVVKQVGNSKTAFTVTVAKSGRLTITPGDLTP